MQSSTNCNVLTAEGDSCLPAAQLALRAAAQTFCMGMLEAQDEAAEGSVRAMSDEHRSMRQHSASTDGQAGTASPRLFTADPSQAQDTAVRLLLQAAVLHGCSSSQEKAQRRKSHLDVLQIFCHYYKERKVGCNFCIY